MKNRMMKVIIGVLLISLLSGCKVPEPTEKKTKTKEDVTTEETEKETTTESTTEETTTEISETDIVPAPTTETSETETEVTTEAEPTPVPTDTPTPVPTDTPTPEPTPTPAKEKCKLSIHINSESNLALAKYSINVYLDDDKLGNIDNGEELLDSKTVKTGTHTLKFEKRGDSSFNKTYTFSVFDDSTVYCSLKSHTYEIEVRDAKVSAEAVSMDAEMPDVTEMRLNDAVDKLKAAGFINISTKSEKTIILQSNWIVVKQNIKAGKVVDKSTEIVLTCEKDG